MHVDGDVLGDDLFGKRNETLGDAAKEDSRIAAGVDVRQLEDEIRRCSDAPAHGDAEEILLRLDVAQHRGRSHPKLGGNVRQRGPFKPLSREDPPGGIQQLLSRNAWWPAHL